MEMTLFFFIRSLASGPVRSEVALSDSGALLWELTDNVVLGNASSILEDVGSKLTL